MSKSRSAMFHNKLLLVLAVLALVVQHEVKCTLNDDLITKFLKLSSTLLDAASALDMGAEKKEAVESDTYTEAADQDAQKKEAIESGTFKEAADQDAQKKEAIESGTYKEASDVDEEIREAIESFSERFKTFISGSEKKPVSVTTTVKPSTGNAINEPICGTRSSSLSHPALDTQRIVGGSDALPGDWPWQVGFATKDYPNDVYCGGSLISNEWIVTAAHCFEGQDASTDLARLGEHNRHQDEGTEEVIGFKKIYIHPEYDSRKANNDIALIQLSKKVNFTDYIRPICVPSSGFPDPSGTDAFVSGWGDTTEGGNTSVILQVATVPVINNTECSEKYPKMISNTMICAGYAKGGIDACQSDSGGPLVVQSGKKFHLIGATSWGYGCAKPNYPGVYARISVFRSYIDAVLSGHPPTAPPTPTGPIIVATTKKPVTTTEKPSTGNAINEPICGTRSNSLSHSVLDPQRIVGGSDARPGDWPWQVGFVPKWLPNFVFCGGSLISNEWIVTAAHCFEGRSASIFLAKLGEHKRYHNEGTEELIGFKKIYIHPKWNNKTFNNDIAMIQLSRKVNFTKYIRPICVPSPFYPDPSGTNAFVSGWGTTSQGGNTSEILQVATVPVINNTECSKKYPQMISNTMICAGYAKGGIDACQGDSGGPLVVQSGKKFHLIGVTSWGYGCAQPDKPGVYARISALRFYIDSVLGITQEGPLACNFEKDFCKWTQSKTDNFDWKRIKGSTPSKDTGPSQSSTGPADYYLYIEASYPQSYGHKATLISPEIRYPVPTCLRFKAHMYGSGTGKLTIEKMEGGSTTRMFIQSGNKGNKWLSFNVDLPKGGPYKVAITAIRGTNHWGDMAIDELSHTFGPCSPPAPPVPASLECKFEKDICKWRQSMTDDFDWTRIKGKTPSNVAGTGPSESSTGPEDHYLYIESSSPRVYGIKATITSPDIRPASAACLKFKYHMYGSGIGALQIERIQGNTKTIVFNKTGDQGNKWLSSNVNLPKGGPYKVAITASQGSNFLGDIAIDELLVIPRPCSEEAIFNCNFENGLCQLTQSKTDNFDWTRRKGSTPSNGTGPSQSSTGLSGYYLYTEASEPRESGHKATLTSPDFHSASPACLKFKAHMFGRGMGTLQIETIEGSSKTILFTKTGNHGNKWLSFFVDLPAGGPYKVAITGTRGSSWQGDMAIDELIVTPKPCFDPAQFNCNFEKSLCQWTQSKTDDFDWTRIKGSTPSSSTGPSQSSTGPAGYYLYMEASEPRRKGNDATLTSPNFYLASPACLKFKAHMFGSNIGTLQIEKIEGNNKTILFTKTGDHGNKWLSFNVDLPPGGPYKVAITGTCGSNWVGDIAIDELTVTPNSCSNPVLACGKPSFTPKRTATRVIGGVDAIRGSWPWQILLQVSFKNVTLPLCGGTLIDKEWVVTAAHCIVSNKVSFIVRVGEQNTKTTEGSEIDIPVKKIIVHPKWSPKFINNDIALLQLSQEVKFTPYVKPVCLPEKDVPAGSYCYITGFGKIKHPGKMHNVLQQARLQIPTNKVCNDKNIKLNDKNSKFRVNVTDSMICGGDGGVTNLSGCQGDSGGPFVCEVNGKWELHGAVSWGSATCSADKGYTVFARVTKFLSWIKENTGKRAFGF